MPSTAARLREVEAIDGPAFLLRRGEIVPSKPKQTMAIERLEPDVEVRAVELPVATTRSFATYE